MSIKSVQNVKKFFSYLEVACTCVWAVAANLFPGSLGTQPVAEVGKDCGFRLHY